MQKCKFLSTLLPFVLLLFPLLLSLSSLTSANVQLLTSDDTASYIYNFLSDQANRAWTTQLTITITALVLVFVLAIAVVSRLRRSRASTTGVTVRAGKAHPAPQAQVFTAPAASVQGGVLCPYCGFDNVQGAKFCVKCGKTL